MITMTTYRLKPFMSHDERRELVALFVEHGTPGRDIGHYMAADNSYGVVITEMDDAAEGFRNILNYTEHVEYETKVMLTIDEAMALIGEVIGED
jgi:hypothetical protein